VPGLGGLRRGRRAGTVARRGVERAVACGESALMSTRSRSIAAMRELASDLETGGALGAGDDFSLGARVRPGLGARVEVERAVRMARRDPVGLFASRATCARRRVAAAFAPVPWSADRSSDSKAERRLGSRRGAS